MVKKLFEKKQQKKQKKIDKKQRTQALNKIKG